MALAILGAAGIALLSGLATAARTTIITDERATAESLVRSQIEYVENHAYQSYPTQYAANPALNVPVGWDVPPSLVDLVHGTDDGIQKVTIQARHNGKIVLAITIYKANV